MTTEPTKPRSEHDALSVPRGTKIISPVEIGGQPLAPGVVKKVEYDWDAGVVKLWLDGDEEPIPVPPTLRLTVEATAERLARLDWAHALLSTPEGSEPPLHPDAACTCPMSVRDKMAEVEDVFGPHHSRGCPLYMSHEDIMDAEAETESP